MVLTGSVLCCLSVECVCDVKIWLAHYIKCSLYGADVVLGCTPTKNGTRLQNNRRYGCTNKQMLAFSFDRL